MKPERYADAVIVMTKRGMSAREAVHVLAKHLERRGMIGALRGLRAALAKKAAAEVRRGIIVLEVADRHHAARVKQEAAEHLGAMGISMDTIEVREDDSLIGGWRFMRENTLVDNSFKKHLLSFYRQLTR